MLINPEILKHEDDHERQTFEEYVRNLRLSPEDFDKKILDVGSGIGSFAKISKERGLAKDIYSVDFHFVPHETEKGALADVTQLPFPDKTFDLVISNCAIPNVLSSRFDYNKNSVGKRITSAFDECVRVAKDGGEVRLAPVFRGDYLEFYRFLSAAVTKALEVIKEKYNVSIEEIKIGDKSESYFYGKEAEMLGEQKTDPDRVVREDYLIVIKKSDKQSSQE
jgi:ubiquinone/menaquinone biosynthesis C-methylase UbiE